MNAEYAGIILALIVGWLLSEGSHLLRYRGEKKKAIRVALAELLEVRHRLIGNEFLVRQLESRLQLPAKILIQLRNQLPTPLRNDPGAPERLNSALTQVSQFDPFLAYLLKEKDITGVVEAVLNPEEPQEDVVAEYLLQTQKNLRQHFLSNLEDVIIHSACRSSMLDWLRAIIKINYRPRVSDEIKQTCDRFLDQSCRN